MADLDIDIRTGLHTALSPREHVNEYGAMAVATEQARPQPPELFDRAVVLPGRLEYALATASSFSPAFVPTWSSTTECFVCIDDELVYARFFADFGPLNLAQVVRLCRGIDKSLHDEETAAVQQGASVRRTLVVVSSDHPHKRANVMTLLALYLVVCAQQSPEHAVAWFRSLRPPFGFRDAACGICTFFLSPLDCARAVYKAMQESIWSLEGFSLESYERLDELYNGDINWIVPGKILAFSGPQRERVVLDAERGRTTLLAHEYARVFRELGVSCVVRFNEPSAYDRKTFLHAGIQHLDLEYPDGGNPPDDILYKFLRTCERETGAVAVHCKAGLGRTGTNIAAYLIKNHRFRAQEAIAWCRICRPGSIVGPQQQFLLVKQRELLQLTPFDGAAAGGGSTAKCSRSVVPSKPLRTSPLASVSTTSESVADAHHDKPHARNSSSNAAVITRRSLAPLHPQSSLRASTRRQLSVPPLQLIAARTAAALRGR